MSPPGGEASIKRCFVFPMPTSWFMGTYSDEPRTGDGPIGLLRSPEQVEALGAGLQLFSDLFRQGIKDGYLIDDDPELMARMVIATQQVRLGMWMDRGCQEDPDRVADAALRHMLRSYCKTERLASALGAAGLEDAS